MDNWKRFRGILILILPSYCLRQALKSRLEGSKVIRCIINKRRWVFTQGPSKTPDRLKGAAIIDSNVCLPNDVWGGKIYGRSWTDIREEMSPVPSSLPLKTYEFQYQPVRYTCLTISHICCEATFRARTTQAKMTKVRIFGRVIIGIISCRVWILLSAGGSSEVYEIYGADDM